MALKDLEYLRYDDEESVQKTVSIEIPNPEHPDYYDEFEYELCLDAFNAGKWAVDKLGRERAMLVGHFLSAVMRLEEDNDSRELARLYNILSDYPLETLEEVVNEESGVQF